MRMSFEQPAPDGTTFAADVFDGQIGTEVPVSVPGESPRTGRVLAAKVSEDGRAVELTIEVDGELPSVKASGSSASFGFR